jgi:hypothetical protein
MMDRSLSRREALGALGLVSASALVAQADGADRSRGPFSDQPVITSTASLDPKEVSGYTATDGKTYTVAFDDINITLDTSMQELSATNLVTYHIPVQAPKDRKLIGYRQTIEGFIMKDRGSRVVIVADVAGTTKVVEYPFGQEISDGVQNYTITFISPDINALVEGDMLGSPQEYSGTLTLLVQRRSTKDTVTGTIDGIDGFALMASKTG